MRTNGLGFYIKYEDKIEVLRCLDTVSQRANRREKKRQKATLLSSFFNDILRHNCLIVVVCILRVLWRSELIYANYEEILENGFFHFSSTNCYRIISKLRSLMFNVLPNITVILKKL